MKILHCCLSCFYIDDALYQENELVREHVALGHNVRVLASTESMSKTGQIIYVEPREYMGSDGAMVCRLPYRKFLPQRLMRKIRMHPNVYRNIEEFDPDVIMFHGCCGWEIRTAAKYVKMHPHVQFFIDSHEDANNSAKTVVSRELLHKRYYGPLLRSSLPESVQILCISLETIDFVAETYKIPTERLEFYPLGGRPLSDGDYQRERAAQRARLGLQDHEIMFFQSGKFDHLKKLLQTLRAFTKVNDPDFRLFLSGVIIDKESEAEIHYLIKNDHRIKFLGWSNPTQMVRLLAAADVYLQPGSQSVTMQNSMCQRCAIVIDNVKSHQPYIDGNGFFTKAGTDLAEIMREISTRKVEIGEMGARSHQIALSILDYAKLAKKMIPSG